jgi:hypothetical protein
VHKTASNSHCYSGAAAALSKQIILFCTSRELPYACVIYTVDYCTVLRMQCRPNKEERIKRCTQRKLQKLFSCLILHAFLDIVMNGGLVPYRNKDIVYRDMSYKL